MLERPRESTISINRPRGKSAHANRALPFPDHVARQNLNRGAAHAAHLERRRRSGIGDAAGHAKGDDVMRKPWKIEALVERRHADEARRTARAGDVAAPTLARGERHRDGVLPRDAQRW